MSGPSQWKGPVGPTCPNCGRVNARGQVTCSSCGTVLGRAAYANNPGRIATVVVVALVAIVALVVAGYIRLPHY